ncbi:uncharacterized protein J8A68_003265 [[Candida] subhashii]|uniref:RNA-polymerase II-associated protein 3-like C-terminal domain-containing protein n=1 Tax=[Candida] subhashii TaxID=561895 RepID=A0A8J5UHT5_9ASCO|nr:uncharacterized protein J8A68_003265 [[Candida] subhashii]KAG7663183.1 hypothetical protein J8A68_003265 [[Candida] subhashii]
MLTAEQLKNEGNKAFANKEYKKAAKIYRDAIQLDMYNPVLYSNRAQCFINLKDYERAYKDCISGINLGAPNPLLTKLYYRQGISLKGLNRLKRAKEAFEMVLKLDPKNVNAKTELENIRNTADLDEDMIDGENLVNIRIENVDELPNEFISLLEPKKTTPPVVPTIQPIQKASSITSDAEKEIKEIFTHKEQTQQTKPTSKITGTTDESQEKSPLQLLTVLRKLPASQKVKGYEYILNLDDESYRTIFASSGIDTDFLQFFLEAAEYAAANEMMPSWNKLILNHLSQFSKFKRYDLSMMMADDQLKNNILQKVEQKHPEDLLAFRDLFK